VHISWLLFPVEYGAFTKTGARDHNINEQFLLLEHHVTVMLGPAPGALGLNLII